MERIRRAARSFSVFAPFSEKPSAWSNHQSLRLQFIGLWWYSSNSVCLGSNSSPASVSAHSRQIKLLVLHSLILISQTLIQTLRRLAPQLNLIRLQDWQSNIWHKFWKKSKCDNRPWIYRRGPLLKSFWLTLRVRVCVNQNNDTEASNYWKI